MKLYMYDHNDHGFTIQAHLKTVKDIDMFREVLGAAMHSCCMLCGFDDVEFVFGICTVTYHLDRDELKIVFAKDDE